ncbi:MAG: HEPN domain-containing protein [Clostridium sp.]|jgi:HEPN domain-containing protein|nr:HEPN domain-containing protein [Clostridium sp.]
MDHLVEDWLGIAEYDFETAKVVTGKAVLYVIAVLPDNQKAVKAIISRHCTADEIPPKIHDLTKLAIRAELLDVMSKEQQNSMED